MSGLLVLLPRADSVGILLLEIAAGALAYGIVIALLYPQPVRAQGGGGVEYLPIPRQKEVAKRPA